MLDENYLISQLYSVSNDPIRAIVSLKLELIQRHRKLSSSSSILTPLAQSPSCSTSPALKPPPPQTDHHHPHPPHLRAHRPLNHLNSSTSSTTSASSASSSSCFEFPYYRLRRPSPPSELTSTTSNNIPEPADQQASLPNSTLSTHPSKLDNIPSARLPLTIDFKLTHQPHLLPSQINHPKQHKHSHRSHLSTTTITALSPPLAPSSPINHPCENINSYSYQLGKQQQHQHDHVHDDHSFDNNAQDENDDANNQDDDDDQQEHEEEEEDDDDKQASLEKKWKKHGTFDGAKESDPTMKAIELLIKIAERMIDAESSMQEDAGSTGPQTLGGGGGGEKRMEEEGFELERPLTAHAESIPMGGIEGGGEEEDLSTYRCDTCQRVFTPLDPESYSKASTPAHERPNYSRASSISHMFFMDHPSALDELSSLDHSRQSSASEPIHYRRRGSLSSRPGSISSTTADESEQIRRLKASIKAIAKVCRALRNGDLTQMINEDVATPDLENLKGDVNSLVRRLRKFTSQVFKVCSDVGQKGLLGKQADLEESAGIWRKMLVDVNSLASNLSAQVRDISEVTTAVAKGDFSRKIEVQAEGEILQAKNTVNKMVDQLNSFATEVARIAQMVGTDGILDQQITVDGVEGVWKDLTDSVNSMASNLTSQVRSISAVTSAIAKGDLSQQIEVEAKGEMADLKKTVNSMVDTLKVILEEVGRVAREVGVEGKLGGQANIPNVEGAWYDLSHSVNQMANNLTSQAVAEGDLSQEVTVQARGEVAALASTVNGMVAFLRVFAAEVTRVALLTGTEGVLGGKAEVANVSGEWKTLVDRVNTMAKNLTDQVREIARVTTAVADGDLTSYVTVDARGEVGQLRDTVNAMVRFLQDFNSEVTRVALEVGTAGKLGGSANVKHARGEWHNLVTGLNRMVDRVTGQVRAISRSTAAVAKGDLSQRVEIDAEGEILQLAETINAMLGRLNMFSTEVVRIAREIADGNLNVRAEVEAVEGVFLHIISEVNKMSGTLSSQVGTFQAITDAAAAGDFSKMANIAAKGDIRALQSNINTMVTKLRTAFESNVKAKEAAEAHSLAKSQFLANTSHEIRTPLNAIIGLTFDTLGSNLTREQRENLNLVRGQADALLRIINDILDITKIEAGRMALERCTFSLREVIFEALTSLAFGAAAKNLDVFLEIHPAVPDLVVGDGSRLGQVVKNLVGNSQKFTTSGSITLTAHLMGTDPEGRWRVEFHVIDTGIGIEEDKLQRIFDSFMQADGSVTRKYGGTGLGLTISRNLVQMMGGHLDVESEVGKGSDFGFDVILGPADPEVELRKQIEKIDTDQCVLLIDDKELDDVEASCLKFGLSVHRVPSIEEVPSGDLFDCAIISTIEEADKLRSNRFLPLVLRAATLPKLDMRRALDFSLASVIETGKGEAELCNALHIALKKSMRKLGNHDVKADWKILLAEDNKINQIVARRLLASSGLKCLEVVENGQEAFEAVQANQYDIVLMDVSMPVKDGREATQDIRMWEQTHSVTPVPIIGVTAHALVGDREKCMKAGMSGVCTKPLLAPELLAAMSKKGNRRLQKFSRMEIEEYIP
ncbi:hypothetical protein PGT21_021348 [Puccinia graminis f. sp. tritici]|uniref:histidine kinase n=1 Tax=Puccinia graminis f. sp. tritici TaxID=56615 RepID=A0A5B0NNL6_PUCGR|nr:hypothetical protein PGT21_021348 [Puccinia graminis f. sp. tritici]